MELVGITDVAPTLAIRALKEKGMPYDLYLVDGADKSKFDELNIPVSGSFEDLVSKVDIMLDSSPAGIGAKNKEIYQRLGVKAVFQGGEKNTVANVFFHGYANFEKGLNEDYLKLTSCNTTGLIRAVDCLDRKYGVERVAITIVRRVADPGDYNRGLTNALQVEQAPSHQAVDLMTIMPHVEATGLLVHTPVTHGHFISVIAHGKQKITPEMALEAFKEHDRIRMVRLEDGFLGNASLFKYGRDLATPAETSTKSQSGKTPWLSMVMISCSVSTFRKSRSPFRRASMRFVLLAACRKPVKKVRLLPINIWVWVHGKSKNKVHA